jgi:hypothetical protein
MWCRDLKQLMADRGVRRDELPKQVGAAHDALADAMWVRDAYEHIMGAGAGAPYGVQS